MKIWRDTEASPSSLRARRHQHRRLTVLLPVTYTNVTQVCTLFMFACCISSLIRI